MEGYISEIRLFAGNFAPLGWAFCQGQLLSIAENDVLYSLLGTTYGGDGQVTFALPDFRGRLAGGTGQGPGLSPYFLGQESGSESITMLSPQLPPHSHTFQGAIKTGSAADNSTPGGNYPATAPNDIYSEASNSGSMAPDSASGQVGPTGNNQPVPIVQPYLAINVIICMEGIYPSRS